jgi:16S rRNA A1518/A1519 N6-dimethyltransferase RsmA/KsgA/DIM1 with predicted DNA glycosylase/AP lyase activity
VDSVVLAFSPRPVEAGEAELLALVRRGFKQPRKTLANNLDCGSEALACAGLEAACRPHQLSEEDWLRLAAILG